MANSYVTYVQPKDRFVQISNSVIDKFSPDVIGVYAKIVKLSSGKSLNISFIASKIGKTERWVRSVIVILEEAGYVVRECIKGEKGKMCGWNYKIYAEPVSSEKRSHAGKKDNSKDSTVLPENRQDGQPSRRPADKTENRQDNIIINNTIHNNIDNTLGYNNKKSPYGDEKSAVSDSHRSPEEERFEVYMKENYPYIMKMDRPITLKEAKKLKELYGEEVVVDVFSAMNNHKRLLRDYRSAYQTANNWCTRRIQNERK